VGITRPTLLLALLALQIVGDDVRITINI